MELVRASVSMTDLRLTPGCKADMASACGGVRGLQQMRRSRSSSRLVGRVNSKVRAAKEFDRALECDFSAAKMFGTGGTLNMYANHLRKQMNVAAAKPQPQPAEVIIIPKIETEAVALASSTTFHCRGGLRQFYEHHDQSLLGDGLMDGTHTKVVAAMKPEPRLKQEFKVYYKKNFHNNSLPTGPMEALYAQFQPVQKEASPPFKKYYQKNFTGNCLAQGVMDALYAQMAPRTPAVEDKTCEKKPEFRKYYQDHFSGNSLGQGAMNALYQSFSKPTAAADESEKVVAFRFKPSVGTWIQPVFPEETAQETVEETVLTHVDTVQVEEEVRDFKFLPSVGTWNPVQFKPTLQSTCAVEEEPALTPAVEVPEAPFEFLPSVGTCTAPFFRPKPAPVLEPTAAETTEEVAAEPAFHARPSVGTWNVPYFRPKITGISEAAVVEEARPASFTATEAPFRFKPSVGTWAVPLFPSTAQVPAVKTEEEAIQRPFQSYYQKHFTGNLIPQSTMAGFYSSFSTARSAAPTICEAKGSIEETSTPEVPHYHKPSMATWRHSLRSAKVPCKSR